MGVPSCQYQSLIRLVKWGYSLIGFLEVLTISLLVVVLPSIDQSVHRYQAGLYKLTDPRSAGFFLVLTSPGPEFPRPAFQ